MLSRTRSKIRVIGFVASLVLLMSACDPAPTSEPTPTEAPSPAKAAPAQADAPVAAAPDTPQSSGTTAAVGAIEPLECKKLAASDPSTLTRPNVSCGLLSVPELHSDPNGKAIKMGFVQFKSSATTPAKDAVIFLGDLGFSNITWVSFWWEYDLFDKLLKERDLIVVDTRGVGRSQPALKCNGEMDEIVAEASKKALTAEDWNTLGRSQAERCKTAWQTAGVNLAAYNSTEIAQDLDDLRRTLGYEKLNVWATGYGTVLAQTLMKLRPDSVRSAVLDSPIPPQANLHTAYAPAYERALNKLFEACLADAKCNKAYPDFKQVLFETVDKLNSKPMRAIITKPQGGFADYFANGNDLMNATLQYLNFHSGNLPNQIYATAFRRQKSMLEETLRNTLWTIDNRATAASLAVFCMDEGADASGEDAKATYSEAMQPYGDVFGVGTRAEICKAWGLPRVNGSEDAVVSEIPTLILSGDWDPNTPPEWPEQVAQGLKNSYRFSFSSYAGNVVLNYGDQCASVMLTAFISNPSQAPESTCLRSLSPITFEIATFERK